MDGSWSIIRIGFGVNYRSVTDSDPGKKFAFIYYIETKPFIKNPNQTKPNH